jgi:hypothetical protein
MVLLFLVRFQTLADWQRSTGRSSKVTTASPRVNPHEEAFAVNDSESESLVRNSAALAEARLKSGVANIVPLTKHLLGVERPIVSFLDNV